MKSLLVLAALMVVRANAGLTAHYQCSFQVPTFHPNPPPGTDAVPDNNSAVPDNVCDSNNGYYNIVTKQTYLASPHVEAFNAEFGSALKFCGSGESARYGFADVGDCLRAAANISSHALWNGPSIDCEGPLGPQEKYSLTFKEAENCTGKGTGPGCWRELADVCSDLIVMFENIFFPTEAPTPAPTPPPTPAPTPAGGAGDKVTLTTEDLQKLIHLAKVKVASVCATAGSGDGATSGSALCTSATAALAEQEAALKALEEASPATHICAGTAIAAIIVGANTPF